MSEQMTPAGWYPDPSGDETKLRWWNGATWVDSVRDAGPQPQDGAGWPQPQQPVGGYAAWAPPGINTASDEYLCGLYIEGKKGSPKPDMTRRTLKAGFRFNWFATLTGPIYFLYRKCYIEAAVILALLVVYVFLPFELPNGPEYLIYFAYGALFYPLFKLHTTKAIATARSEGLDEAALQKLRRKGGTNLVAALILSAVVLLFLAYAFYIIFSARYAG